MKKLNWMLNPLIIFASIFPLVSLSETLDSDSFKIVPYLIKKNSNQVHLRFKKEGPQKLYFKNNLSSLIEVTTKEDEMTTLSSSIQKCDKPLRLTLNDEKENILYKRTLEPFPCDPQKAFSFAFISDTQKNPEKHNKMAKLLLDRVKDSPINFIINGGDIVQDGSVEEKWTSFLNASVPYSQVFPIVPILGNHDYWGHVGPEDAEASDANFTPKVFNKYLGLESDNKYGYYALDYPQFKLIVLNSNFPKLPEKIIKQQMEWTKKELQKSKEKSQTVIISFHHAPFTSNIFYYGPVAIAFRNKWIPLFEESGVVKLILNGHSHLYERSLKNGIMYVVSGPFGGQKNWLPKMNNYHRLAMHPDKDTFSIVKVTSKSINMESFDQNNQMIDSFSIDL
ncbi:MAG: hypothetical protein CME68_11715 [Halobacteriovoraceae bacterium]|nr:hypothetical protein [Halobacteriovoraceae bacterium]